MSQNIWLFLSLFLPKCCVFTKDDLPELHDTLLFHSREMQPGTVCGQAEAAQRSRRAADVYILFAGRFP